jgi:hypothetical protein
VLAGMQVFESHPLASEVLTPLYRKGGASVLIIESLPLSNRKSRGGEAVACCLFFF